MSAPVSPPPGAPVSPPAGAQWRLVGSRAPRCPFGAHRRAAGLDETARRLSHSELAVAALLVSEGHLVRSVAERPGRGRSADLEVCGQSVEVKTWLPPAERGGRAPTARSVRNKLVDARGQGATAVLWARGSGLSAVDAERGVEEFLASGDPGGIVAVRIVGDGFDLGWAPPEPQPQPQPHQRPQPQSQPQRPGMVLGRGVA